MSSNSLYKSYVVDIILPPAIIVSPITLTIGYTLTFILDYFLMKHDTKLSSFISPTKLRYAIGIYHFLLPTLFASKYDFGNISFMLHPWSTAAQVVFLAKANLPVKDWIIMFFKTVTFQDDSLTNKTANEIRIDGLKKAARGLLKFAFMKIFLDGLLPKDLSDLLSLPFYSPKALFITYILAVRIYCMLGVTDIVMGIAQSLSLIRFKDVFDNPFIASSPKDFWNKRWNRLVNHMFHQFIFTKMSTKKPKQPTKFARIKAGLLIFAISGLFHDFMIAAATRTITFELTVFFLIHGMVVALEATYRTGKFKSDPTGINHIICNMLTVLFFTTTGRLFLSPILRQQVFLRIAQQF
ncbi:hypothetical protein EDC94DRAFT_599309 [Helicostylum pulchrum]|nr:hypothetical protein EDC94DRAFT_599309 [Helicostylum pulchrum]